MKFTITKVFFLLCLLLIFGMSSCEKDLYEDQISQSKFKVEEFSLKDNNSKVSLNSNFLKAVSEIKKTIKNTNGKIVYDSINQIYFDDEKGIKISKDEYESYTFNIIKEDGNLENLVFCKNNDGEFYSYKIKYSMPEDQLKNLSPEQLAGVPKDIFEMDDTKTVPCGQWVFETITSPRDDGDPNGPNAVVVLTWVVGVCDGGSGTGTGPGTGQSGDGSGFGGNNSTGYGDGSGNNNNSGNTSTPNGGGNSGGGGGSTPPATPPIVTTPVLNLDDEVEDPCNRLKDLYDTNTLNTKVLINEMKTKVNDTIEHGYSLLRKVSASGTYLNDYTPEVAARAADNDMVEIEPGYFFYGGIHTHSINGTRMFSWGDLKLLKNLYKYARTENKEYVVLMMVVRNPLDPANPNVYAIRINDFARLEAQLTTDLAGIVGIVSEREKIENIHKNLGLFYKTNDANIEKAFLERFSNYGISLYKANNTLDNWSNLYLQKNTITNTQSLTSIPCAQ